MRKKHITLISAAIALALLFTVFSPLVFVDASENTIININRISGASRYDTAVAVSQKLAEVRGVKTSPNIVIASGTSYADALAGVPLADNLNAPILLTAGTDSLEQSIRSEIKRLDAENAYILGGTGAISESIKNELKAMGLRVIRIYGTSRYETAAAIAQFNAINYASSGTLFLVSGSNFPDALAVGSVASIIDASIMFVPKSGEIDKNILNFIEENSINRVVIVGGPSAIASDAEDGLLETGVDFQRIYGDSRYDTAMSVYMKFSDVFKTKNITIATGKDYPDALAGGVLSAALKAPLFLVRNNGDNEKIADILGDSVVYECYVYGGERAVSTETAETLVNTIAPPMTAPIVDPNYSLPTETSTTITSTTTVNATTTTASTAVKTTVSTTEPTVVTTTTTATVPATFSAKRWVNAEKMKDVVADIKAYAASVGMQWEPSLNAENSTWGSNTRAYTTSYTSAAEFEARMRNIVGFFASSGWGYEYVNAVVTDYTNGEYCVTCYFG